MHPACSRRLALPKGLAAGLAAALPAGRSVRLAFVFLAVLVAAPPGWAQRPAPADGGAGQGEAAPPPPPQPPVALKAGWGKGVNLEVLDEFTFQLRGRMQLRFTAFVPNENSSANRFNDIAVRRARVNFKAGWRKELSFNLQLGFAPLDIESDQPSPLRDAYLHWSRWRDLQVRVGQMKVPFDRQYLTSSVNLELADRTVAVGELHLERDVGLVVRSDDLFGLGLFQYQLAVMGGEGRNRIGLNAGLLFAGRVQVTPLGTFKDDLTEADLMRHERPKLMLGFAYARNNATVRERSTHGKLYKLGAVTYDHLTADLVFKWYGLAVQGGWLWRRADKSWLVSQTGEIEATRSAYAFWAQASFAPMRWLSFGARYSELFPMEVGTAVVRARELGGYVAGYLVGHDLKLQLDYLYLTGERFEVGNHQVRLQIDAQF